MPLRRAKPRSCSESVSVLAAGRRSSTADPGDDHFR